MRKSLHQRFTGLANVLNCARVFAGVFATVFAPLAIVQAQQAWAVDANPLVIGSEASDITFASIWGATRMADGRIVVADNDRDPVRLFSAQGKLLGQIGRSGSGPGEVRTPMMLLRCADTLYIADSKEGFRVAVFTSQGAFVRNFRFGLAPGQQAPYATSCHGNRFVHIGWEDTRQAKPGTFRTPAPVWRTRADNGVEKRLGDFPASERFGLVIDGQLRGTRPLPFGRETRIAMARDRIYVGTAVSDEIQVFDLEGRALPPLRTGLRGSPITPADINAEREKEKIVSPIGVDRDYKLITFPQVSPAYSMLLVDSDDLLWVQSFPLRSQKTVWWHVYNRSGTRVASMQLPTMLDVLEVGRDYVLGRYVDTDEAVPQVRMYRFKRGA